MSISHLISHIPCQISPVLQIAKLMPGRTENGVKNRFNSSTYRRWCEQNNMPQEGVFIRKKKPTANQRLGHPAIALPCGPASTAASTVVMLPGISASAATSTAMAPGLLNDDDDDFDFVTTAAASSAASSSSSSSANAPGNSLDNQ